MDAFYNAAAQLPREVSEILLRVKPQAAQEITEICLRSERAVALTTQLGARFVLPSGSLIRFAENGVLGTSHSLLQTCFESVCGYSVHSVSTQIANGFVPMPGGHRAGICGTAYQDSSGKLCIKNITSIHIRIARTELCACDNRLQTLLKEPVIGIMIAGAPSSGKTTILRAAAGELSRLGRKTAVIDERFELAPVNETGFSEKQPAHCDILSGYPRHIGMQHALRALSPDVIICDEIGTQQDVEAIAAAANAGVGLIVTIHANGYAALRRRPQYRKLIETGAFTHIVFLKGRNTPGEISEVIHVETDF